MQVTLTRRHASSTRPSWALVGAAVFVQVVYPLMPDALDTIVTVLSVVVFFLAALADVVRVHGPRGGLCLVGIAGGGGLVAEAVGLATGVPFGSYAYTGTLGPEVLGVPVVVPLAWAMMAWPALVVGRALAARGVSVVVVGALALAAWDLFLDPQMVDAGHWRWADPTPGLPGVPTVPLTNYAGWVAVALVLMAVLARVVPVEPEPGDAVPYALYLWTYASSVLAHLAFFGLPASAGWGGVGMGAVAVPLALALRARAGARASR